MEWNQQQRRILCKLILIFSSLLGIQQVLRDAYMSVSKKGISWLIALFNYAND